MDQRYADVWCEWAFTVDPSCELQFHSSLEGEGKRHFVIEIEIHNMAPNKFAILVHEIRQSTASEGEGATSVKWNRGNFKSSLLCTDAAKTIFGPGRTQL